MCLVDKAGCASLTLTAAGAPLIDRERTRASENEGGQAREIEQDDFISNGTELRAACGDLDELHGEEAVGQMDREQRCQGAQPPSAD